MVRPAVRDVVSIRPATSAPGIHRPPTCPSRSPGVFYRYLSDRGSRDRVDSRVTMTRVQYHVLRDSIQRPFDFDWDT